MNNIQCDWCKLFNDVIVIDNEDDYKIHLKCLEEACLCDKEKAENLYFKIFGKEFWS